MEFSEQYKHWQKSHHCPHCEQFIWYTRSFVDGHLRSIWTLRPPDDPAAIEECPRCNGRWFAYDQSALLDVVEGPTESEVMLSREVHMDNAKGTTPMLRTKTITQDWSQTYELSVEEGAVRESSISVGKADVATISAMAQNALKTTYRIGQETRKTYTEEIPFDVPPEKRQVMTLTFRRIWQHGILKVVDPNGEKNDVRFKVVVDLEMDMVRKDE